VDRSIGRDVSLVDFVRTLNLLITSISKIVSEKPSFIWDVARKTMDKHNRVVILPLVLRKMFILS
jgi:hypothetical protein